VGVACLFSIAASASLLASRLASSLVATIRRLLESCEANGTQALLWRKASRMLRVCVLHLFLAWIDGRFFGSDIEFLSVRNIAYCP
jgi:hypothetical protein